MASWCSPPYTRVVTAEQAKANTGWELKSVADLRVTQPPSDEELRILRQELDPEGIYLKGGA